MSKRYTQWIMYSDIVGLQKSVTDNNTFGLVMPRISFERTFVKRGSNVPRVRLNTNPENETNLTVLSDEEFAYFDGILGVRQTDPITFEMAMETDAITDSGGTYTKFVIEEWELVDIDKATQAQTDDEATVTYQFYTDKWKKQFETYVVWEYDARPGHTPVKKQYKLTVDANGIVTGVSADAVDFAGSFVLPGRAA